MPTARNPEGVHAPLSRYSHAVEVDGAARWIVVSGQVGMDRDGTVPSGIKAQIEQAFENVFAVLDDAGMGQEDLVKITVFLVDKAHIGAYREVRDRLLTRAVPASTLLIVAGLASDALLVEIEAIAAR